MPLLLLLNSDYEVAQDSSSRKVVFKLFLSIFLYMRQIKSSRG